MDALRPQRMITPTADGSDTLYIPSIGEHYHSVHGAIQESTHVFIEAGFKGHPASALIILEVGFGTGLNSWLTSIEAVKSGRQVDYYSIEKYPLLPEEYLRLNYPVNSHAHEAEWFTAIHQGAWETLVPVNSNFRICKIEADFNSFDFASCPLFDLIYFDAFSPDKQPEMWQSQNFLKLFKQVHPEAILVTYCARGQVRRDLISAGFTVERMAGPPGKREMLRAKKPLLFNDLEAKF